MRKKKLAGINSSSTLTNLLELNNFILAEKDYKVAVKKIIEFAQSVCNADGYLLYIINDDDFLSLEYTHVDSLGFDKSGSDNMTIYPTVYIPDLRNKELKSLAETSALNHELINTSNIYASTDFDNSISKWFDQEYNYRIVSCLTLPILNRKKISSALPNFQCQRRQRQNHLFHAGSPKIHTGYLQPGRPCPGKPKIQRSL